MQESSVPRPPSNENSSVSGGSNVQDIKRRRQPRNSACQPCAALKMRCVSGPEGGKCERCQRMNKECLPPVPKPRKRRAGSENEIELSPYNALKIDHQPRPTLPVAAFRPAITSTIPAKFTSIDHFRDRDNVWMSKSDVRENGSRSFSALFSTGLASVTLPEGIDYAFVQTAFTSFRDLAVHFPFVNPFSGVDVLDMVAQRPMTAAAICCITATDSNRLSEHFNHIFRLALAAKAIVDGECSIDLFVGLLIYVAWHNRNHRQRADHHEYRDLCLLTALATSLSSSPSKSRRRNEDPGFAAERDRALLGCYYLCSRLSRRGFNQPNPFRWTDDLRIRGEDVYHSSKQSTDRLLIALVEMAHAIEDLYDEIHDATQHLASDASAIPAIEMCARMTLHRFKALKREHPLLTNEPAIAAATIEIYRIQLSTDIDTANMPSLIRCACAIKEYLDDIITRSASHLYQMPVTDWTDLLAILVYMATLARRPVPTHGGWESGALSTMLEADRIFDGICARMAEGSAADGTRSEGLAHAVRDFCARVQRDVGHASGAVNGERERVVSPELSGYHFGSRIGDGVWRYFSQSG